MNFGDIKNLIFAAIRPVFNKVEPEKGTLPPGIAEGSEVTSLQDALDEAKELIGRTKKRLEEIHEWYIENWEKLPPEVRRTREDIRTEVKKCEDLAKKLAEYHFKLANTKGSRAADFANEDGIREETIAKIDKVFADYFIFHKEKVEIQGGLEDQVSPLSFKEEPMKRKERSEEEAPAAENSTDTGETAPVVNPKYKLESEKRKPGESDGTYASRLYGNVVKILIKQAETGETTPLSGAERSVIMLMAKGDSKNIDLDGETYVLEKDNKSHHLRLRDFPGTAEDPVLSLTNKKDDTPSWRIAANKDIELEATRKSFENNWMALADNKAVSGSKLLIGDRVSDSDPYPLEVTLQNDGMFRVSLLEKVVTPTPDGNKKTDWTYKRSLIDAAALSKLLTEKGAAYDEMPSEFHPATEQERVAEENRYMEEKAAKLAKLTNDAVEAYVNKNSLGGDIEGFTLEGKFNELKKFIDENPDLDYANFKPKQNYGLTVAIQKDSSDKYFPEITKENTTEDGETRLAVVYPVEEKGDAMANLFLARKTPKNNINEKTPDETSES